MTAPRRSHIPSRAKDNFSFSGQERVIVPTAAIPLRWPTKTVVANEYLEYWHKTAAAVLADLRLARQTLDCIASHTSRRLGTCCLADKALSARSGRSLRSTQRDINRLVRLGYLVVQYANGDSVQERVRVLKPAVPLGGRSRQRILHSDAEEVSPTYTSCVGGLDIGDRRDVE